MKKIAGGIAAVLLVALAPAPRAQQSGASGATLVPTDHPKVPRDLSQLWLVPARGPTAAAPAPLADLATAITLESAGEYSKALTLLSRASLQGGPLGGYAAYYAGEAQLKLGHIGEAKRAFEALDARQPVGYLAGAAAIGDAEADEAQNDFLAAVAVYERLLAAKLGSPDDLLMRIGRAAKTGGDNTKAAGAFSRVYYEFPLSELAPAAGSELQSLPGLTPLTPGGERYRLELGRAERLFGAKQYVPARASFDTLRPGALGDDRELVSLRLAECDYFQKHPRLARDAILPYIDQAHASRQAEALFFYALASLDLGSRTVYLETMRRIADDYPTATWAEDALDSLAGYFVQQNDDERADVLFGEMYGKFPKGSHAERAAWRLGWRAYREGRYTDTVGYFEQAAHDFPRSDYRPPWLYWSGRAHEQLNEQALAEDRYKLATADYINTYHGRLAIQRLHGWTPAPRVILVADAEAPDDTAPVLAPLPPNGQTIRQLLSVDLFDDALNELRFAARMWGDSSAIQATTAWIERQQGRSETGTRQFELFRGSINTMKRAYPQYLAAGGEQLPRDLLAVIFPVAYRNAIREYSSQNNLDPYLVTALVAQESTFVPDIKSYASAVGLMQFMAPTARQYAKRLNMAYSAKLLTNADASLRMGTAYFADLVRSFGEVYLALAAYNAGPSNVRRWIDERPGMGREEFIDDIPYPQTQNYVKKVLSTAEDYRRLYGPGAEPVDEPDLDEKPVSSSKKASPSLPKPTAASTRPAPARKAPPASAQR
jgi:soluble lytic murein transglycosylase